MSSRLKSTAIEAAVLANAVGVITFGGAAMSSRANSTPAHVASIIVYSILVEGGRSTNSSELGMRRCVGSFRNR